jgi:hypothetical protein
LNYLERKTFANAINIENLALEKNFIGKIEFDSILRELYANPQAAKRIEDELYNLVKATPQKYITLLS